MAANNDVNEIVTQAQEFMEKQIPIRSNHIASLGLMLYVRHSIEYDPKSNSQKVNLEHLHEALKHEPQLREYILSADFKERLLSDLSMDTKEKLIDIVRNTNPKPGLASGQHATFFEPKRNETVAPPATPTDTTRIIPRK